MRGAALALLLLAACSKSDGGRSTGEAPAPPGPPPPGPHEPPPPPSHEPLPAVSASPAFVVATDARIVSTVPLRWLRDGHLWEAGADPRQPIDLGAHSDTRASVFDADHEYVSACTSQCDIDHGQQHTLTRIDRRDGTRRDLVEKDEFAGLRIAGDHLLWMHAPFGPRGELRRMHRDGGAVEVLWRPGGVPRGYELRPGGILAWSYREVVWIPDGQPAQVLADGLRQPNAAALDATHVYIAEHGDPYGKSPDSGRILRIPRRGGAPEVVAAPVRWPRGVAVDDRHVYWISEEQPSVMAAAKGGGPSRAIDLPPVPGSPRCGRAYGLIASATGPAGLYVSRSGMGAGCAETITFVPTP